MKKVKDSFVTTMEKAIIRLDPEDREGKFNRFMVAFFTAAFLCICTASLKLM